MRTNASCIAAHPTITACVRLHTNMRSLCADVSVSYSIDSQKGNVRSDISKLVTNAEGVVSGFLLLQSVIKL